MATSSALKRHLLALTVQLSKDQQRPLTMVLHLLMLILVMLSTPSTHSLILSQQQKKKRRKQLLHHTTLGPHLKLLMIRMMLTEVAGTAPLNNTPLPRFPSSLLPHTLFSESANLVQLETSNSLNFQERLLSIKLISRSPMILIPLLKEHSKFRLRRTVRLVLVPQLNA